MEKVCIFCGKRPVEKTKEHILPKWLIKLTGNPKRFGFFGHYQETNGLKEMHLNFDQFTFPSCKKCNKGFGNIEAIVKPIIIKLLTENSLNSKDINLILTWFDKVRIGLWLGSLYYNNLFGINPNFYIKQGAFSRDRMIILYKNKYAKKRLNFIGIHHVFQMLPICFTLIINNFAITNIAKIFLLSKGFGIVIPKKDFILTPRGNLFKFEQGSQKIHYPVVDITFNKNCTEFYQPIINQSFSDSILPKLNKEHKNEVFMNENSGIGNIFYFKDGDLKPYPNKKTKLWIPPSLDMSFLEFSRLIGMQTLEIQNHYLTKDIRIFNPKMESIFEKQKSDALLINKILIDRLRNRDFEEFNI